MRARWQFGFAERAALLIAHVSDGQLRAWPRCSLRAADIRTLNASPWFSRSGFRQKNNFNGWVWRTLQVSSLVLPDVEKAPSPHLKCLIWPLVVGGP